MVLISKILSALKLLGVDISQTWMALRGMPKFYQDYRVFRNEQKRTSSDFPIARLYPVLGDHLANSGVASGHYFHQDLIVARWIYENSPGRHVDVASRVDGFVSHVAVFREIEVADIRPLITTARNIRFVQCDIMDKASVKKLGQSDSVSCLHSIEHFGLGRYGDPIKINGHVIGLRNLASIVGMGGRLYVSVPIGPERTEFNGQRVFNSHTIPQLLREDFKLEKFAFVNDAGDVREGVDFNVPNMIQNFGCTYGCGIYQLYRNPKDAIDVAG